MRFKKILLIFFGIILLLAGGVFVVGKYYNTEVKDFVFKRINERMTAPLKVDDIELTLFADFPNASLRFTNVTIGDKLSRNQSDTLLYAEKMFLSFNFWDIWNKNYKITKVKVEGGMFHLAYNKKGESNLDIWKHDNKKSGSSDFQLDLNAVQIDNLFFHYTQPANGQSLRCFIKSSRLSGKFSEKEYQLQAALNARVYSYEVNRVNYLNDKDLSLESSININNTKSEIGFTQVNLGVNTINLQVDGFVNYSEKPFIDLAINGKEVSILELMTSLPEFSRESLKEYETDGFLTINSRLKGNLGKGNLPSYTADFTINKASLVEKSSNVKLSDLDLKGHYSTSFNGENDSLNFKKLAGSFSSGKFNLSGSVVNFSNPDIHANVSGNVELGQLYHFLRWQGADSIAGQLIIDARINGVIESSDTTSIQLINKLTAEGSASLRNGRFKLRYAAQVLQNVVGELTLEGNLAMVKNLRMQTSNSDFTLNGIIDNLVPYLLRKDQQMSIEANLTSKKIDLGDFIDEKAEPKSTKEFRLAFPQGIKGNLTTHISSLHYKRFTAEQISGRLRVSPDGLLLENLDLKAFSGRLQGSLGLVREGDHYLLKNQTTLTNIELDKAFYQFEDFGQTILTHKEIKGKTDATVTVVAKMTNQLKVDDKSLTSTIQLKVKDGELTNLQVLQDLAGYLKSNTAINAVVNCNKLAERLKKISFSTLENAITIKDRKIIIPEMTIKSSALDINVNGTHSFDNHIDYGLNFRMAEVFKKNVVTEYGYIVDDNTGMRMFIAISGTTDNPVFKYDKLSAAQARKDKFQQEKETFKGLLKQEFGLFKSDTTVKKVAAPTKAPVRFELEYEPKKPKPTAANPIPAIKEEGTGKKEKAAAEKPSKEKPKKKKEKVETDDKEYDLDGDI